MTDKFQVTGVKARRTTRGAEEKEKSKKTLNLPMIMTSRAFIINEWNKFSILLPTRHNLKNP